MKEDISPVRTRTSSAEAFLKAARAAVRELNGKNRTFTVHTPCLVHWVPSRDHVQFKFTLRKGRAFVEANATRRSSQSAEAIVRVLIKFIRKKLDLPDIGISVHFESRHDGPFDPPGYY